MEELARSIEWFLIGALAISALLGWRTYIEQSKRRKALDRWGRSLSRQSEKLRSANASIQFDRAVLELDKQRFIASQQRGQRKSAEQPKVQ